MDDDEQSRLLDLVDQPIFILESGGSVRKTNKAARDLLGYDPGNRSFKEIAEVPGGSLSSYLARCSGTGSPMVGSLTLKAHANDGIKVQAFGVRLSGMSPHPPLIALRCVTERVREFSVLARHLETLNRENRRRRKVQEELEQSLQTKETLLYELHHRVRNQMQMLLAMFSVAGRHAEDPALSTFVATMNSRLHAMTVAQDLMYDPDRLATVPAPRFLETLSGTITASWPRGALVSTRAVDTDLRNDLAVPLALIVNELLANALRHGLGGGSGQVAVDLEGHGDELLLTVEDDGPGLPRRIVSGKSSGLALVRGLCEQIGGSLETSRGEGLCVTIRFPRS